MLDFLLDPVGEIARASLRVNILTEAAKRKMDAKKARPCDFCDHAVEERLGSGLLCGFHYFKFFGERKELATTNS